MAFTARNINVHVDLDTTTGKVRIAAAGGLLHPGSDWHDDPQQAWDQFAATVGPQLVTAARLAQQPLPADD